MSSEPTKGGSESAVPEEGSLCPHSGSPGTRLMAQSRAITLQRSSTCWEQLAKELGFGGSRAGYHGPHRVSLSAPGGDADVLGKTAVAQDWSQRRSSCTLPQNVTWMETPAGAVRVTEPTWQGGTRDRPHPAA